MKRIRQGEIYFEVQQVKRLHNDKQLQLKQKYARSHDAKPTFYLSRK